MWYLKKPDDSDQYVYLKPFEETTFGRKKGSVRIVDDESISRLHASIYVQPKNDIKADEPTSTCVLTDNGSKYGTYVIKGDEKIEVTDKGCVLDDRDIIRFGVQDTMFNVTYVPIITVVSSMSIEDKSTLQNLMDHMDGVISTEWTNNCTHLTVSNATLTEKVTWALASALPIVTVNYWIHVKEAMENNKKLPEPHHFIPPIGESLVDKKKFLLRPNEKRKTLFKHLIFVHFSLNQYKIYGKMIHLAGGKSLLYSKKPLTNKELCSQNVIVLQYPGDEATQATQQIVPEYNAISKALQKQGRKMIAESEIPLAILHCSVEKFCNPKFRFSEFLKRSEPKPDTSEVLALDTQDVGTNTKPMLELISVVPLNTKIKVSMANVPPRIIPETYDTFSQDVSVSLPVDQPQRGPACSTPLIDTNKSTKAFENNISPTNVQKKAKATSSKEIAICIPETYDSFVTNVMSTGAHSSTQNTIDSRKNELVVNAKMSKQGMEVNSKQPVDETIDLSEDDEVVLPGANRGNKRVNKVIASKRLDTLAKRYDDSVNKSSDTNEKSTDCSLVMSSVDDIMGSSDCNYVTDADDSDELFCRKCKIGKQHPDCKKRKRSDDSGTTSSTQEKCERNRLYSDVILRTTSDSSINFKRFKKAPVPIPAKRIGMNDLYVWADCVV